MNKYELMPLFYCGSLPYCQDLGSAFMLERIRKHDLEGNGLLNVTSCQASGVLDLPLHIFSYLELFPLKHVYR